MYEPIELENSELSTSKQQTYTDDQSIHKRFIIKYIKQSKTNEAPLRVNKPSSVIDILTKNALNSEKMKTINKNI